MDEPTKINVVTLIILVGILLLAGLATYYFAFVRTSVSDDAAVRSALTTDDAAAGFTDMEGNKLTLSGYFGETLLVTSWASWCPQCATDLPLLNQFAGSGGVDIKVLAVNRAENKFTAERFLNTIGDTTNLLIILDPDDHFFEAHEGYAMPETILYDKEGNVVVHQRGNLRLDEIQSAIEELSSAE